ncbi:MAG: alpha/beta hydrolase [Gammaproteobacteria bacterium]|nr:alpha/beta hydrolase [Gammaproteobacteria bacterium]
MTEKFQLPAPDGHVIHGTVWQPATTARGVLQVFHGLGEHHLRYERFAALAASRGLAVVAHDHRGHGEKAQQLGHFADTDGWRKLSDDGLLVNDFIQGRFADLPLVLIGHSMGSYIAQYFAMQHANRFSALVLSASTWPNKGLLFVGRLLARILSWRLGVRGNSPLLHKMGFGDFNKPFEPARTELDWLSRDESEVDKYIDDPLCGGPYSCGLWLDLMGGLQTIASDNALHFVPAELPILFTGGSLDPVGGDKGIASLAMHYAQTGHSRITVKVYDGGRHEMLNETNRDEFSRDLLDWIEARFSPLAP